jgi:O-methyltransferase
MDIQPDTRKKLDLVVAFSSNETIRTTYLVARKALEIRGCFVECGVATGGGSAPMAIALVERVDNRTLHMFDSFEGLPQCGVNDHGQMGLGGGLNNWIVDPNLPVEERLKATGISIGTIDQIKENFGKWGCASAVVEFHKGWFQHTLPGLNLAPIAFLRLDGDLYESTMCCLDHLYDQVAPGGYIWLDELGMPPEIGGHKAMTDFFKKRGLNKPTILETTDTGAGYWRKE